MGPWANQVVNPDSQGCGAPTYKGMKSSVEVVPSGKVLDAVNLISLLKEAQKWQLKRLERSQDAQRVLRKETALFDNESNEPRPGEILCTIGDKKITQGDLDFELNQLPPYIQSQITTKEKKIEYLKQKIAQELLFDSAKRKGLDKDKEILESTFRAKKEFMAQKILNEEIQKMINISEDDVELYFRANKDKYTEKDEKGNIKRQKSFQEAAQLAANDLMREKQEKAYTQLLERLMKAQNVKIYESKIR